MCLGKTFSQNFGLVTKGFSGHSLSYVLYTYNAWGSLTSVFQASIAHEKSYRQCELAKKKNCRFGSVRKVNPFNGSCPNYIPRKQEPETLSSYILPHATSTRHSHTMIVSCKFVESTVFTIFEDYSMNNGHQGCRLVCSGGVKRFALSGHNSRHVFHSQILPWANWDSGDNGDWLVFISMASLALASPAMTHMKSLRAKKNLVHCSSNASIIGSVVK